MIEITVITLVVVAILFVAMGPKSPDPDAKREEPTSGKADTDSTPDRRE